jgi:hypothetical protein
VFEVVWIAALVWSALRVDGLRRLDERTIALAPASVDTACRGGGEAAPHERKPDGPFYP